MHSVSSAPCQIAAKHAYLIMAHKDPEQLKLLISLLDDPRNDIFVHCDKKSDPSILEAFKAISPKESSYAVFSENAISWGSYALIDTELKLLKKATKNNVYGYYHLLSGTCLPLKSQDVIHQFFDQSQKEFVGFCNKDEWPGATWRAEYPHIPSLRKSPLGWRLDNILGKIHKLGSPKKTPITYGYGSQWFSITHSLACDLLAHEDWIREHFCHSFAGDELFLQSFIMTFGYEDRLPGKMGDTHHAITNMRLIDWARGDGNHPYTWHKEDFDTIMQSEMLFGRKFSLAEDDEVIYKLIDSIVASA